MPRSFLTLAALPLAFSAALTSPAQARPAELGEAVMTILYQSETPEGEPVTFDFDYYRDHHLTLIMDLYGDAISRFELIRPQAAEGAPAPRYAAVVNIYIADQAAFDAAQAEHGQTLVEDVANFTNAPLYAQPGVIYGLDD